MIPHEKTLILLLVVTAVTRSVQAFLSRTSTSTEFRRLVAPTSITTTGRRRFALSMVAPFDVQFGTSNVSGASWGEEDENDDQQRQDHQQRVAQLLEESDQEFKEQRKRRKWGKFANVTSTQELEPLLQEERSAMEEENQIKAALAAQSGIEFQMLEPKDESVFEEEDGSRIQIQGRRGLSWFASMDEELESEWKALSGDTSSDTTGDDLTIEDGKLVSRNERSGVRVGSAGGWSLEVFPGDFVVHRKYGIGRFERTCLRPKTKLTPEERKARDDRRAEILTQELRKRKSVTSAEIQEIRSVFGTEEDKDPVSNPQTPVLEITYADAVVHVPVDRAYRLSRYRSGDAVVKPRLSRVKGEAWSKAKRKVEENTMQLAEDVLALYATRELLKRQPFSPTLEDKVKEFEETFPYEPTPDQKKCFEDIENDMVWRNRPMDRLVCGDVGFGKTEVAFRALYRAVVNGRQCALLAPTGVLAAQHFKNIVKRMGPDSPFKINIALLRGGTGKNTKVGKALREQLLSGEVQLVVGTHALLSNDLKFKDLGLLVVDEEQRFGVVQKERLKVLCSGIDVLTLSATPIPRTLQMSLSGIRDTSTIKSPPPMRKPTITYVQDISDEIIRMAISQEISRGGQCYYVVPKIAMLDEAEERIKNLFPDLSVIQAHGRMSRNGAEENVAKFAEGEYDVLLATTVIENGVDIPTVNTIIVQDSQQFGMSTLYQLRGRVGRSDLQAYAYFLHRVESITEQSVMRLQAIGELNELGSGFDVANRDLEIRGAGSLLGTEQSGMAARVGFDLYMRMLKKSIRKLRGLDLPLLPRTNVLLKTNGTPGTFTLPKSLIPDDSTRLKEETAARLAESTTALVSLTNHWKNSYGDLPASLQGQLKTLHLHACTRRLGVDLVGLVEKEGKVDCILRSPGLRPRHLAIILENLPRPALPKGVDVVFPGRLTLSKNDEEYCGGRKINVSLLKEDLVDDEEEEDWDTMDQEEIEAMKDISSAAKVQSMDEIEIDQYPHFVVHQVNEKTAVDQLLKFLLPISKVVYEQQEAQAEEAKHAADLREKQELLKERKKQNEAIEAQRLGYNY